MPTTKVHQALLGLEVQVKHYNFCLDRKSEFIYYKGQKLNRSKIVQTKSLQHSIPL